MLDALLSSQYVKELICGEYRSRTDDLLRARQALSPAELIPHLFFVDPGGLEPPLFWTKTRRVANYTKGQFVLFLIR